jgi:hypothetical protein
LGRAPGEDRSRGRPAEVADQPFQSLAGDLMDAGRRMEPESDADPADSARFGRGFARGFGVGGPRQR